MKRKITKKGLEKYLGDIVEVKRDNLLFVGVLRFGDLRDKGIVNDLYRSDRNETLYVNTDAFKGISSIGIESRDERYGGYNVPLNSNDIITVGGAFTACLWPRTYVVDIPIGGKNE